MNTAEPMNYLNGDGTLRVDVYRGHRDVVLELVDVPASTFLYSVELEGQPSNDDCRRTARSTMYGRRPGGSRDLDDDQTLDCLAALLRRPSLSGADLIMEAQALVNRTGRDTSTPGDCRWWQV